MSISLQKRNVGLTQFPTSSASLNRVESHCLHYIPIMLKFSRTLVNVMGDCFDNEFSNGAEKYEIEVTKMGQNNPLFLAVY